MSGGAFVRASPASVATADTRVSAIARPALWLFTSNLLYAACQRVLRPGGVLAVITASTPGPGGLRDDPGEAITRARAAGLVYTQHIVAVHAAIRDSQITPGPGDPAPVCEAAVPAPVHSPVHSDVLVFTKP